MDEEKRFEYAVSILLRHEGGYSDDKADPGGATNYGVSLRYLKSYGIDINDDGKVDVADIRALTKVDAKEIYRKNWWDRYGYNAIDDLPIAAKVFDLSVNMGDRQAHKLVQRAVNVLGSYIDEMLSVDGILGKKSIEAINDLCRMGHGFGLLDSIKAEACDFYRELVDRKPVLGVFLKGWLRRAND